MKYFSSVEKVIFDVIHLIQVVHPRQQQERWSSSPPKYATPVGGGSPVAAAFNYLKRVA